QGNSKRQYQRRDSSIASVAHVANRTKSSSRGEAHSPSREDSKRLHLLLVEKGLAQHWFGTALRAGSRHNPEPAHAREWMWAQRLPLVGSKSSASFPVR